MLKNSSNCCSVVQFSPIFLNKLYLRDLKRLGNWKVDLNLKTMIKLMSAFKKLEKFFNIPHSMN